VDKNNGKIKTHVPLAEDIPECGHHDSIVSNKAHILQELLQRSYAVVLKISN
jgi:hypothetical protein